MSMIKCQYCGQDISDKAEKCVHCDKNIKNDEGARNEPERTCEECGAIIEKEMKFCARCGCPIEEHLAMNNESGDQNIKNTTRKDKVAVIMASVLLFVFVIVLIGLTSEPDYKYEDSETSTSESYSTDNNIFTELADYMENSLGEALYGEGIANWYVERTPNEEFVVHIIFEKDSYLALINYQNGPMGQSWRKLLESTANLSATFDEAFDDKGLDISCDFYYHNPLDEDKVIASIHNGIIMYDFLNE